MKSIRLPSGSTYFAHEHNALRADAKAASFLLVHQQLGALALGTNPSNNQTVTLVINGTNVVFTAVSSIGAAAGNFLIGASAAATVANLYALLINPTVTTATGVALSSANAILVQYLGFGLPTGGTTITPYSLNSSTYGPLSSFSASTTVTSGSWTGQTMQLYVEPGSYYVGATRVLFLGGSTPTVTAPSSHPRIDIVTADSSGTIAITTGSENVSPVAPSYPANKLVLAEIYNVVGETALYDNDYQQAGQGYVYNDVRPVMAPPYISSVSQVGSGLFIPDPGSDVQGDIIYFNGSNWVNLTPGTNGQVLLTGGAGANPSWGNPTSLVKILDQNISAGSSPFTTSAFAGNGYLRVVVILQNAATSNGIEVQFNSDTGSNYFQRYSISGGTQTTATSTTNIQSGSPSGYGGPQLHVFDIMNISGVQKIVRGYSHLGRAGVSSASDYSDWGGVWNNTSVQITTITLTAGSINFTAGDRIIVYGN